MQTQLRHSLNVLLQQFFTLQIFGNVTVLCWCKARAQHWLNLLQAQELFWLPPLNVI